MLVRKYPYRNQIIFNIEGTFIQSVPKSCLQIEQKGYFIFYKIIIPDKTLCIENNVYVQRKLCIRLYSDPL